jgi:hypothetical protein
MMVASGILRLNGRTRVIRELFGATLILATSTAYTEIRSGYPYDDAELE